MTAAQKKMAKMKTSKLELPGRGDVRCLLWKQENPSSDPQALTA